MPETSDTLTSTLLARVRDPQGLATSRLEAAQFLTHAQRLVNIGMPQALDSSPLVLERLRMVYPVSGLLPLSGKVLGARDADGRPLPLVEWRALKWQSPTWFRDIGDRPLTISRLGRDSIVVYPALHQTQTITVLSAKVTSDLTAVAVPVETTELFVGMVLDIGELLILLKQRHMYAMQPIAARLKLRMTEAAAFAGSL